ncbi:unnamed protein product [Psylliodes chrysocephalus]|uniref:Uncharacterized protein n=1 Tax=Psylliodes chrysocephalus TaxID=3402493 RepID=A0A9P0D227_9CUCU|nr:unnamed protein product [Psylliodes chrysocephala]
MFANVNEFVKIYKEEEQYVKVVFITIENHLAMLVQNFKKYFLDDDKLVASYEWVRDSFRTTLESLSAAEEEIFIEFTASDEIQREFSNKSLFEFWAGVDDAFSPLKTRTFRILLLYYCEAGFSAVAASKTKYRSRLIIDKELRVAICNKNLLLKNFAIRDRPEVVTNNY